VSKEVEDLRLLIGSGDLGKLLIVIEPSGYSLHEIFLQWNSGV